jgi:FkbM family methyltransferase
MTALVPGDIISGSIAFTGFYDLALTRRIRTLSIEGGLMVDVGANLGYFSLLWAAGNKENRAVAFEPSPRNLQHLARNIQANALDSRISIRPCAASHCHGSLMFDPGPEVQTGWGGLVASPSHSSVEVAVTKLDSEFSDIPIDLLKIDVEGADTWVLRGCESLLARRLIKKIVFEQNRSRMTALGIHPEEAASLLRSAGYECVSLDSTEESWLAIPK